MKRFRICNFTLDTSRNIFNRPAVGDMEKIKEDIKALLISRYGDHDFDAKFARYMELEKPAISIIVEHTDLLEDICNSYVQGNLYPALTGACCLGERIFNDIIFKAMDNFKLSDHYKYVYGKESIINWKKAIELLSDWKIIDNETSRKYKELYKLRTESVHYQIKEQDLAEMALKGINAVNFIINRFFGIGSHRKDVLIYFEVPGELFIKKEAEQDPVVKAFYIPCSILVRPRFKLESGEQPGYFRLVDHEKYEEK